MWRADVFNMEETVYPAGDEHVIEAIGRHGS